MQLSISEPDYLTPLLNLADDTIYSYEGRFAEVDRVLAKNTGTLTIRALLDNPNDLLSH